MCCFLDERKARLVQHQRAIEVMARSVEVLATARSIGSLSHLLNSYLLPSSPAAQESHDTSSSDSHTDNHQFSASDHRYPLCHQLFQSRTRHIRLQRVLLVVELVGLFIE